MGTGASAAQNQVLASQQAMQSTLHQNYNTAFAGQQNILNGLTKSLQTTLNAGPSQFGFSAPETTALNTLATTQNSQEYQNARAAAGEAAAAAGGGATLPTGAANQTQAEIAAQAAQTQSNSLLGIQEAGYKQGNANYNEAVSGLNTTAGIENPTGIAGAANSAGEAASNSASTIQKANAAASPWAQVGGLVGSLGGAALNAFAPGAGSVLQKGLSLSQYGNAISEGQQNAQSLSPDSYSSALAPDQSIPYQPLQNF